LREFLMNSTVLIVQAVFRSSPLGALFRPQLLKKVLAFKIARLRKGILTLGAHVHGHSTKVIG